MELLFAVVNNVKYTQVIYIAKWTQKAGAIIAFAVAQFMLYGVGLFQFYTIKSVSDKTEQTFRCSM